MKGKHTASTYFGTFSNTPENHAKIKSLSKALRATGVKFRMFRYGRGANRKAIWQKQVEHSVKTGKGWESKFANTSWMPWRSRQWRPRLMFCERFDVYLEIEHQRKTRFCERMEWYRKLAALKK
jgi:hypothetical protein